MKIINLKKQNVDVVLFTLPYNPNGEKLIITRSLGYSIESKVKEVFNIVEKECTVKIINIPTGCEEDEFYDLEHFKPSCFEKIKRLL
jgi:hypothetical protein